VIHIKGILSNNIKQGETSMKKSFVIVAMAFVLMMAVASPALAKYAGFSSTTQYVDWTVAASLASQNVDAAAQTSGPHKGYATTTIKCAVCHSVHRGGSKLLNSGSACTYCHTSAGYGGGAVANTISWTNGLLGTGTGGTSGGPHASCASTYCHGGPHGVGASTFAGPATRLLVAAADTKLQHDVAANGFTDASLATWSPNTRALATGAVCSRATCHVNSAMGVITAGAPVGAEIAVSDIASPTLTGHRVVAAATTNWNANGTDFPSTKTGLTVAYAPVTYCNSCHDLADDNNAGEAAFPHGNNDVINVAQGKVAGQRAAVWLTAAADSASQHKAVGAYNNYAATGSATYQQAGSTILDGTCLKCHKSPTSGIGVDF
jgi:hypothetical protein